METQEPDTYSDMDQQIKARSLVYGYAKSQEGAPADLLFSKVKVVWFCKTLKNWKAMVAILLPGGMFFEVTYNGEVGETYVDVYSKVENVVFKDSDI